MEAKEFYEKIMFFENEQGTYTIVYDLHGDNEVLITVERSVKLAKEVCCVLNKLLSQSGKIVGCNNFTPLPVEQGRTAEEILQNWITKSHMSPTLWSDILEAMHEFRNQGMLTDEDITKWIEKMKFEHRNWFDSKSAMAAIEWLLDRLKK